MEHIPMDKDILRKFLKCGYIEDSVFYPTEKGIPQGGCISSVICNMVLDGLEKKLEQKFMDAVHLIRYADDIMIIIEPQLFMQTRPGVEQFLAERGLQLSREKTTFTHVRNGVTFLGYKIYKENSKIFFIPSRESIDSLLDKTIDTFNKCKYMSYEKLCQSLKQTIRGWLNYYRNVALEQSLYGVEYWSMKLQLYCLIWPGTRALQN